MELTYTKRNIIRLLKSYPFLKERVRLFGDVGIIIEKNVGGPTRYAFGAYSGSRIVFKVEKNNYDVALDELHSFLVRNSLIPKAVSERYGEGRDVVGIRESPFKKKAPTTDGKRVREKTFAPIPKKKPSPTGTDRNEMLSKVDSRAREMLPKLCGRNIKPSDFYAKASGGFIGIFSGKDQIFERKESMVGWKGILLAYLMSVPERIRMGLPVAESVLVNYDGNKHFFIRVHDIVGAMEEDIPEEKAPFSLCDKDDWYVNYPALLCWLEDLFREKKVHRIDSITGS